MAEKEISTKEITTPKEAEGPQEKEAQEPEEVQEARRWYKEAEIMWAQGRSLDALARYEEAFSVFQRHGLYREAANAAEKIGDIYFARSNFEKALKPYKLVLDICEEFGDEIGAAVICEKIIFTYQKLGQPERTLPYFYRSLEIAERFGDAHRAARALVGIGDVRKHQGEYDVALEAYELAAKIYRGVGSREQAQMVEKAVDSLRKELDAGEGASQG